jgi:hypothetical protein
LTAALRFDADLNGDVTLWVQTMEPSVAAAASAFSTRSS